MGAATRPAARRSRTRSNQRTLLVMAAVCLATAVAYLCLSINQALRGDEDPLPSVVFSENPGPAPAQAAEESPEAPPNETTAITEAPTSTRPRLPDAPVLSAPPGSVPWPELETLLLESAGEGADHMSISVRRISDDRAASLNGDFQWYAASLFKLAILYEAELRHARGELQYTDRVAISEEDLAEDLGTLGSFDVAEDGTASVEDLLRPMIEISDNVAAVALLHYFGGGNIDATLRQLGAATMTVNTIELWTTADDLALLMRALYTGNGLTALERGHARELLLGQRIRGGIPAALEGELDQGLRIGNKTGTWEGAQHDVAFVEAQTGAYVIAILTDGSYEGWQALHNVTRNVHELVMRLP